MIEVKKDKCLCHSGKKYAECCEKFHKGTLPSRALELMRSRYSAYANQLADYIIETTHPESPYYLNDRKRWTEQILAFCKTTQFEGLDILVFIDGEKEAYVTFYAHLKQLGKDSSFQEKSRFEKIGNKWHYIEGRRDKG
jgi:SEC-C motif domain protein